MLLDSLKSTLITAMKARDVRRVETLRFLLSAARNAAIATYGARGEAALTDEDVLGVVKKLVKSHRESIDAFEKAQRLELAAKEKEELAILEAYLPKQLSDEEIQKLLMPIVSSDEKNFGAFMRRAMKTVAGQADGGRVSAMLKQMLSSS